MNLFKNGTLYTNDPDSVIVKWVTIAQCGGLAIGYTRFEQACYCDEKCSKGERYTIRTIKMMPDRIQEMHNRLKKLETEVRVLKVQMLNEIEKLT